MKKIAVFALLFNLTASAQVPSSLKDMSPGNSSTSFGDITTPPDDNILACAHVRHKLKAGVYLIDLETENGNVTKKFIRQ